MSHVENYAKFISSQSKSFQNSTLSSMKESVNEETVTMTRKELADLIETSIINYLVSEGIDIIYKDPKTGEEMSAKNSTDVPKQQGTLSNTQKKKDKEVPATQAKPESKNAFTKPELEI